MFRCGLVLWSSCLVSAHQTCSKGADAQPADVCQENNLLQKAGVLTKVHTLDLDVAQHVKGRGQVNVHQPSDGPATSNGAAGHIQQAAERFVSAWLGQNMEQILSEYTENSVVTVYDQTSGRLSTITGLEQIQGLFTDTFNRIGTTEIVMPVVDTHEATNSEPGSVFIVWSAPASGYVEASATFIYDDNAKILKHNIAITDSTSDADSYPVSSEAPTGSGPVHSAWNNIFTAIFIQNVDMILADYTEESVITLYNQVTGEEKVLEGLSGVRVCYQNLFANLHDRSDMGVPIMHIEEGSHAQVFLIWRVPASGYVTAAETFIFSPEGKILRQNVVVHYDGVGALR